MPKGITEGLSKTSTSIPNTTKGQTMIVATLHKSKAPNAAWLVEVKDLGTGEVRHGAFKSLGPAKKEAVLYASSFLDAPRKRLPWVEDTVQAEAGIGYFRAEIDA